jgi:DNA modification methylase
MSEPLSDANQNVLEEIESRAIAGICEADRDLIDRFRDKFVIQPSLTRPLVSFQANKKRPIYRWYKYKEAFSAALVEYLFQHYGLDRGRILDPFAGSGTALFAASEAGIDADGIELLPIGQQIIKTKKILDSEFRPEDFARLKKWLDLQIWQQAEVKIPLPELRITQGAYPETTKTAIEQYLGACQQENANIQIVLQLALLCVLESMSYTRKDGQYLRWDYRSGRGQNKKNSQKTFDKGEILDFDRAINNKLQEILDDLAPAQQQGELFAAARDRGEIQLYGGSCLQIMPLLPDAEYDAIITSPPYCNRYDYTRTYALELALLGIDEKALVKLRQEMLSCTVENRPKDLLAIAPHWQKALSVADEQKLLQAILNYLELQKQQKKLNNTGIPRMVRGYFYEMACVIQECSRILKPNALLFTINDNVRYAGAKISVDAILSDFALLLGFEVENILVLPSNKGNSSQQMGNHGREPLRKCVYVWRKL